MDSDHSDVTGSVTDPAGTGNEGTENGDSVRPSAIDRQRAAMQHTATHDLTHPETPHLISGERYPFLNNGQNVRRFVRRTGATLLLIGACFALALATVRTYPMEAIMQTKRAFAQITKSLQKVTPPAASAGVETTAGIVVPISDVSLRFRPELLQQLVAVFRLRLANAPHDAEAVSTLARMREHSLAEIDAISAAEDLPIATHSLKLAAKLFPELVYDPHYQALAARIDWSTANQSHQATADAAVATEQAALAATSVAPPQSDQSITPTTSTTAQPAPAVPETKPDNPARAPVVLPPAELSMPATAKTGEVVAAPLKPEIHVISLTPGIIDGDRFIPTEGGNVFMLAINYRNLGNGLNNRPGGELVTQLASSNDLRLLGEVPVEISGSRGKKSFLIGTFERGHTGEAYKLNFILDGHVLPTRTARLSLATYAEINL